MKKIMILLLAFSLLSLSACTRSAAQENITSPAPTLTVMPQPTESTTPTQPPVREGDLKIDVVYHPIAVDGLTEVKVKEGEGIELDLDGDGIAEQMYVCGEGIFVNEKRQLWNFGWLSSSELPLRSDAWKTYWIVDVDPSDSYYNLIFKLCEDNPYEQEAFVCYAGAIIELGRVELLFSDGFSGATYYGDGTFQMKQWKIFMGISYAADVECYLLDGRRIIERYVSIHPLGKPIQLQLLESVTMYLESSIRSESIVVEPQPVLLLAAGSAWGLFRLEDGTEAWLYAEEMSDWMVNKERPAREIFDGFPNVP